MRKEGYWVKLGEGPWRKVSKAEYMTAERAAGFYPTTGANDLATSSFEGAGMRGLTFSPDHLMSEHLRLQRLKK
jgi:hypothetical protein